ncbi:MAG: hypothetical protein ACI9N1_000875 [Flavobacteriales bacterium]|jgi:hypothetical protein
MKCNLIIFLTIIGSIAFGQKETLVFKISKPESTVTLNTADSIFYEGGKNYFTITVTGNDEISHIWVDKAKVVTVANGLHYVEFKEGGTTIVKIHLKSTDGRARLGLVQEMTVKPLPIPIINLCGVKQDSSISTKQLVNEFEVRARMPLSNIRMPVLRYTLIDGADTIKISGDKIPLSIKPRLINYKEGDVIELIDIEVLSSYNPQRKKSIPKFSVFVVENDQYSVGTRKYINGANPAGE